VGTIILEKRQGEAYQSVRQCYYEQVAPDVGYGQLELSSWVAKPSARPSVAVVLLLLFTCQETA